MGPKKNNNQKTNHICAPKIRQNTQIGNDMKEKKKKKKKADDVT